MVGSPHAFIVWCEVIFRFFFTKLRYPKVINFNHLIIKTMFVPKPYLEHTYTQHVISNRVCPCCFLTICLFVGFYLPIHAWVIRNYVLGLSAPLITVRHEVDHNNKSYNMYWGSILCIYVLDQIYLLVNRYYS